jgi:hypothetical protein
VTASFVVHRTPLARSRLRAQRCMLVLCLSALAGAGCSGSRNEDLNTNLGTVGPDGGGFKDHGECIDEDGDGRGAGCARGPDCDDADPAHAQGSEAFVDGDGDAFGAQPVFLCVDAEDELPSGYALEGGDCDDQDAKVNPGVEVDGCDEIDIDCDDKVDEDRVPLPTTCGAGACQGSGESRCTDEGVVNNCATGEQTGSDDDCNGRDDDCDGVIDDGYQAKPSTCMRDGCSATGMIQCVGGIVVDDCSAPTRALSDSTCDGLDDDCDGRVDEDFAAQSTACGAGACVAGGQTRCDGGRVVDSCVAGGGMGADDDCDNVDDDCDGLPDDGFVAIASNCGAGACRATGRISCLGGQRVDSCTGSLPGGSDTTCDGIDDDCNGEVDEDFRGASRSCGRGACLRMAADRCVNGQVESACAPGSGAATDATCNGIDDDCSGEADEDFSERAAQCGVGACQRAGAVRCLGGDETDSCTPGAATGSDNDCDGVDDDCDGSVDEAYVATRTTCGAGACAASGFLRCVSGSTVDTCSESAPGGSDATCDGVDSDCDGRSDDDYVARSVSCGVGACRRTVQTRCADGVEVGCTPGAATGADDDCDGVDDDCDGSTDEDYASAATSCGVGACARSGRRSCVAGRVLDSCAAGTPAASDANCDNVDDDCNGTADEDYSVVTSCGLGVCRRNGTRTCRNGQPLDSCAAGAPTAGSDTSCNGVDEDCSGAADEDFVVQTTRCGVGACARTGQGMCVAGQVVNSCMPGMSTSPDTDCDGVDDDCDGAADDNYPATATACGIGLCSARGTRTCVAGTPVDSCTPGRAPSSTDATCDGVDDDCSGSADEDFVATTITCGEGSCVRDGTRICEGGRPVNRCSAPENTCTPLPAAACQGLQLCTGRMSCTGTPCGCTTPACNPILTNVPCNTATGQSCSGSNACGLCGCFGAPVCDRATRFCNREGLSCGRFGCASCDCQACASGCDSETGQCRPRIILDVTINTTTRFTAEFTAQTIGQLVGQTTGPILQSEPGAAATPSRTGTTSMFTEFFQEALGIADE